MGLTAARPDLLPVLVRAVPRLLERVRGRDAGRVPVHPRRRHDQHRPAAVPARTRAARSSSPRRPTPCIWRNWPRRKGSTSPSSPVRAVVVAGEPGGNIPATRERIESVWGARVFDHYGMTEVGPVAVEADGPAAGRCTCSNREYLAEVLTPNSDTPGPDRRVRRTGADEPRPRRQPAHPLPHRRPRAGRDRRRTRPAGRGGGSTVASSAAPMI